MKSMHSWCSYTFELKKLGHIVPIHLHKQQPIDLVQQIGNFFLKIFKKKIKEKLNWIENDFVVYYPPTTNLFPLIAIALTWVFEYIASRPRPNGLQFVPELYWRWLKNGKLIGYCFYFRIPSQEAIEFAGIWAPTAKKGPPTIGFGLILSNCGWNFNLIQNVDSKGELTICCSTL